MPDAGADRHPPTDRRRWMAVLARATCGELEAAFQALRPTPRYTLLRRPETGLVMVRGRAGGIGEAFNLGEMTMTRCAARLASGATGLSFVAGRDSRQAELAAVFDALLQDPQHQAALAAAIIDPLARRLAATRARIAADTAATRVDFFTLAREA